MGLRRSIVAPASTMVLLVLGVAGIVAAGAPAQEPTTVGCDERPGLVEWDGDAGTSAWSDPANWVGDVAPAAGGHACIAVPGATVAADAGTASLASLQVAPGSVLVIAAGDAVLDLAGPEPSTIASLFMSAGTLSGAGTRTVTDSAVLDVGTLAGSGRTVIAPEARLQVGSGAGGTLTLNGGHVLALEAGATGNAHRDRQRRARRGHPRGQRPHGHRARGPAPGGHRQPAAPSPSTAATSSPSRRAPPPLGPGPPRHHRSTPPAASRTRASSTSPTTAPCAARAPSPTRAPCASSPTARRASALLLDSDGTLAIEAGTLDVAGGDGGLGSDGAITVAERSRLRLRDGATTLGAAASVSGAGEIEVTTNAALAVPASATWDIATTYLTGGDAGPRRRALPGHPGRLRRHPLGRRHAHRDRQRRARRGHPRGQRPHGHRARGPASRWAAAPAAPSPSTAATSWPSRRAPPAVWGPGPHDIVARGPQPHRERRRARHHQRPHPARLGHPRQHGHPAQALPRHDGPRRSSSTPTARSPSRRAAIDVAGGDGGLGSDGAITVAERSRLRLRDGATTLGAAASVSGAGEIEVTTNAALTVPASATWDIATTYLTGGDAGPRRRALPGHPGRLRRHPLGRRHAHRDRQRRARRGHARGQRPHGHRARGPPPGGQRRGGTLTINGGHVLALEAGATGRLGPGPPRHRRRGPQPPRERGRARHHERPHPARLGHPRQHGRPCASSPTARRASALLLDFDGTLAIEAGCIDVAGGDGGLGSDGAITIAERSRLRLRDGATTLGAAASVSGAGEIEVTTNAALTVPASATWDIATTYLTGGALALDGERSLATLGVYAGTLSGAGTRTVTGSAVLDAGTLAGSGRTVIAPEARLQVGSGAGGTLTINGGHVLAIEAGATGRLGPGPPRHRRRGPQPHRERGRARHHQRPHPARLGHPRQHGAPCASSPTARRAWRWHPRTAAGWRNDGTIEVVAGLLDIGAPGLDNRGTIVLDATLAESGQIRTPAFGQAETATYQVGVAGTTPMAGAGLLTVTTADVTLAGTLAVVADPRSSRTRRSS